MKFKELSEAIRARSGRYAKGTYAKPEEVLSVLRDDPEAYVTFGYSAGWLHRGSGHLDIHALSVKGLKAKLVEQFDSWKGKHYVQPR